MTQSHPSGAVIMEERREIEEAFAAAADLRVVPPLILGFGGGLYWLLTELACGIVVVYYGWILLIEDRR